MMKIYKQATILDLEQFFGWQARFALFLFQHTCDER